VDILYHSILDKSTNQLKREPIILDNNVGCRKERKKEIPYKEGKMKDIGAHVGYTILWGRV
jgi:hypothetical protein